jgi:hypothetical protein
MSEEHKQRLHDYLTKTLRHGQGTASVESSGEVDARQIPTPSATTAQLQEGRVRRIKGTDPSGEPAPRGTQRHSPVPDPARRPAHQDQFSQRLAVRPRPPTPSGQNSDVRTGASSLACRHPTSVCTATGLAADPSPPAVLATHSHAALRARPCRKYRAWNGQSSRRSASSCSRSRRLAVRRCPATSLARHSRVESWKQNR